MWERLRLAALALVGLVGLVAQGGVPITLAVDLFESKVESVMQYGRWLWALIPGAQQALDEAYEGSARELLGVRRWRNGAAVSCEIGWHLSGYARAVYTVAGRRATVSMLGAGDTVGEVFQLATNASSWATKSQYLLNCWGVGDWATWPQADNSYARYKAATKLRLAQGTVQTRSMSLEKQRAVPRYTAFQHGVSNMYRESVRQALPWYILLGLRSWSRLRVTRRVSAQSCGWSSQCREGPGVHFFVGEIAAARQSTFLQSVTTGALVAWHCSGSWTGAMWHPSGRLHYLS